MEPLSAPDAVEQVARTRQNSIRLLELRRQLRPILSGKHCLIIGAGPHFALAPHDVCFCVKGAVWSASQLGIDKPHLTLAVGWAFLANTEIRKASLEAMRGRRTETLLFLESGADQSLAAETLAALSFSYDQFLAVSSLERAVIIGGVCGEDIVIGDFNNRPSNGLFAVAIAMWAGASVTLTGFSRGGGHAYAEALHTRLHLAGINGSWSASPLTWSKPRTVRARPVAIRWPFSVCCPG